MSSDSSIWYSDLMEILLPLLWGFLIGWNVNASWFLGTAIFAFKVWHFQRQLGLKPPKISSLLSIKELIFRYSYMYCFMIRTNQVSNESNQEILEAKLKEIKKSFDLVPIWWFLIIIMKMKQIGESTEQINGKYPRIKLYYTPYIICYFIISLNSPFLFNYSFQSTLCNRSDPFLPETKYVFARFSCKI